MTSSGYQEIYADTVGYWPGFVYLVGSGMLLIAMVCISAQNICYSLCQKKENMFVTFYSEQTYLFHFLKSTIFS